MIRAQQSESQLVIRYIPITLYIITGIFTLPLLWISLVNISQHIYTGGTIPFLIFSLGFGGTMLEFVATREEIVIDRTSHELRRTVKGMFRKKIQRIPLHPIRSIVLETKPDTHGTKYRHLYLRGNEAEHLINNPKLLHDEHRKIGKLISDFTCLPFVE